MQPEDQQNTTGTCATGTIIGEKYELIAELGSGGMGTVFKVRHISLPKFFAAKILRRDLSNKADFRARFDQEAKTASLLNHPHLVSIYDYGCTELGEAYLVMDFIKGNSLAEALAAVRRLDQKAAVKIFIQICEGLAHAHGLGILHRDLKPSNVMLLNTREASDFVKVVDFGLAKIIGEGGNLAQISQSMTKTGQFYGSPLYMSPEQANGGKVDQRTDIYSMGILMYECLTSHPPFRGENFFATMVKHSEEEAGPFEKTLHIAPALEDIVFKAIEKDPDRRFQSMEELKAALVGVFDQSSEQNENVTKEPTGSKKRNAPFAIPAAAFIILSTGACACWFLARPVQSPAPAVVPVKAVPPPNLSKDQPQSPPPQAATNADDLPPLPDTVQLPEKDKTLTAAQLAQIGRDLSEDPKRDWRDLLPARYFMTALQKDPKNPEALAFLTTFYWNQGIKAGQADKKPYVEKCLATYSRQIALNPTSGQLFLARGSAHMAIGDQGAALADAQKAVQLEPKNKAFKLFLAQTLFDLRRLKEAIALYEANWDPSETSYMYSIAACYEADQQYEKGLEFASKWLNTRGQYISLQLVRADCLFHLKRYRKALDAYLDLKKVWPETEKNRGASIKECQEELKLGKS